MCVCVCVWNEERWGEIHSILSTFSVHGCLIVDSWCGCHVCSEATRTSLWSHCTHSLAGQPLATPTTGRGESGKIPIIVSYLTRQEFLGVLSGFKGAAVAFQYTSTWCLHPTRQCLSTTHAPNYVRTYLASCPTADRAIRELYGNFPRLSPPRSGCGKRLARETTAHMTATVSPRGGGGGGGGGSEHETRQPHQADS